MSRHESALIEPRPSVSAPARVTIAASDDQFSALESAWQTLAAKIASPSVFLSYEWFSAAWQWRRLNATLEVLVATIDDEIVAILPLIRPGATTGRTRALELLTVPDTQLVDMVVAPERRDVAAEAFARALARKRDWDVLRFDYLLPDSAVVGALVPALLRCGIRITNQERTGNPFVRLDGTWHDYHNTRSRSQKKALNLAANRLQRSGAIQIEWLTSATADEARFDSALGTAIDVSRRSWKSETGNALDRPGPQAFIRALSQAAFRRGWASIWLIHVEGRALAMEYQLIDGTKVHALRADFDAGCVETSPGTHLFAQLLERLFGRGLQRYYMGPGDNSYKKRWAAERSPLRRATAFNRTLRGRWLWLFDTRLRPAMRAARDRWKRADDKRGASETNMKTDQ